MPKNILIVGGAGFVGSVLARHLLRQGHSVCIVDNLLSAEAWNIPEGAEFIFGSIHETQVLRQMGTDFDWVFHLATYHGNQSSIANPMRDHEHNTLPMLTLCEHFKNTAIEAFVYASAGCTVAPKGVETATATDEEAPFSLYHDSPYQISKIVGELYGNYYATRYQLPFIKARFQNVYGPGEILGAGQWRNDPATIWRNVIPTFVWRALHHMPLVLHNGGTNTRDFIYVDDIAAGLIACAEKGKPCGVYNLASGVEHSIRTVAEQIQSLCGSESAVEETNQRDWDHATKRFGATQKSQTELGFRAKTGLKEGLEQTIDWTKQHRDIIQHTMARHAYFCPDVAD